MMFLALERHIEAMEVSTFLKIALNFGVYGLRIGLVVLLGLIGLAVIKRLIRRLGRTWRAHGSDRKADTLAVVLQSLSRYIIGFIVVCAVLGIFNIPMQSILAVAGIGSVAIGFGAQSLVKDFITGFFILLEDQFGVGDLVTLSGKTGTVEAIGMRTTRVRGFDGEVHIFPNSQIQFVTNLSSSYRRVIIDVTIKGDDADKALNSLCEETRGAMGKIPSLTGEPSVLVITDSTPGEKHIRVVSDCQVGGDIAAATELKRLIQERFDNDSISCTIK